MLLNLTDLSNEPLQSQMSRQIRAKILAGDLPAGTDLPSIRAMAREQRISVITVQRAYENLEREGLIYSRRGKGFFVSELSDGKKKMLAYNQLMERLKPTIKYAMAEGLTREEIVNLVETVIKKF